MVGRVRGEIAWVGDSKNKRRIALKIEKKFVLFLFVAGDIKTVALGNGDLVKRGRKGERKTFWFKKR